MLNTQAFKPTILIVISTAIGLGLSSFSSWAADSGSGGTEQSARPKATVQKPAKAAPKHKVHRHVRKQVGEASIYGRKFAYKTMANGKKMDPNDDNAASKTLPLGTKAKVTNLETGLSTMVTIEDRGPYVDGRIVDLSPAKAEEIGLTRKEGVAKVEVEPVEVPLADSGVPPSGTSD